MQRADSLPRPRVIWVLVLEGTLTLALCAAAVVFILMPDADNSDSGAETTGLGLLVPFYDRVPPCQAQSGGTSTRVLQNIDAEQSNWTLTTLARLVEGFKVR